MSTDRPLDADTPLTLSKTPDDADDDALPPLVARIEAAVTTAEADGLGVVARRLTRQLAYIAVTSEDDYTLADLSDILADADRYNQFCAQADANDFPVGAAASTNLCAPHDIDAGVRNSMADLYSEA